MPDIARNKYRIAHDTTGDKTRGTMAKNPLTSIMDPDQNGLKGLPRVVRFQLMVVLASLWSAIFCVSAGVMIWLPGYLAVHVILILIGTFGTSLAFKLATPTKPGSTKLRP
jgi:hypothetical protein